MTTNLVMTQHGEGEGGGDVDRYTNIWILCIEA